MRNKQAQQDDIMAGGFEGNSYKGMLSFKEPGPDERPNGDDTDQVNTKS